MIINDTTEKLINLVSEYILSTDSTFQLIGNIYQNAKNKILQF